MQNALELIAFAHANRMQGTLALLDAAQRAMDQDGHNLPAAVLEIAREAYLAQYNDDFASLALARHG